MAKGKKKRRERAILRVKMKKVLWTKLNETVRKEEEEEKERKKDTGGEERKKRNERVLARKEKREEGPLAPGSAWRKRGRDK